MVMLMITMVNMQGISFQSIASNMHFNYIFEKKAPVRLIHNVIMVSIIMKWNENM